MESKETMRVLDSVPPDINESWHWSITRTGFTQKRNKTEKQNSPSGNLLRNQENLDPILGFCSLVSFKSRNNE